MNDVHILNESSAITMYYGYTKYRDNFVKQKINVDTTIEKYILFIDSGHSKTSFILSYFKYNLFKVIYVTCIPNIGGRNFDEEIMKYCINEFLIKENIKNEDFNFTNKMKYRLLESIKKARIQLTVNTESQILVDVFYNDIDLDIILTREKFEELIKNNLEEIDKYFNNIINYAKKKNIIIDCVEIAGELMRTPILQIIVSKLYWLCHFHQSAHK
jgi:molecular chaperone DnaK (HSP70)